MRSSLPLLAEQDWPVMPLGKGKAVFLPGPTVGPSTEVNCAVDTKSQGSPAKMPGSPGVLTLCDDVGVGAAE